MDALKAAGVTQFGTFSFPFIFCGFSVRGILTLYTREELEHNDFLYAKRLSEGLIDDVSE